MKLNLGKILISTALAALIASCGGGGDDEAGGPTPLALSVTGKLTLKGADAVAATTDPVAAAIPAQCPIPAPEVWTVYIYGGTAPYRVDVGPQDVISVFPTQVDDPGQSFKISTEIKACITNGDITVVDSRNNRVVVTVDLVKGS